MATKRTRCKHCRQLLPVTPREDGRGRPLAYCTLACRSAARTERDADRRRGQWECEKPAASERKPANPVTSDRIYDDREREFLTAAACYRQRAKRPFLMACDYLHILLELGYVKVATGQVAA